MTRCFSFYRDKPKTKHCLCGITLIQCDKCIIYYQMSLVIAAWCSHGKTVFQDYLQNRHQPRAQARTSYNSPVSAIRRPRRDAVNIDIWFHAQNRLVFHLGRHLELISMDVMWVMFLSSSNLLLRASRFYRHWSVSDVSDASGTSLRITHHASSDLRMYGSTQYGNQARYASNYDVGISGFVYFNRPSSRFNEPFTFIMYTLFVYCLLFIL